MDREQQQSRGDALPILLIAIVVIAVVGVGLYVHHHRQKPSVNQPSNTSTGQLSDGNSDQDLNSDLQNINSGLNQADQNLNTASGSLKDQQLPVTE